MSNLSLRHLYKVYPNGVKAVNDFNMEIEDKEFIVFVGPSGCGKSTTLRMIAGLEEITAGELYIGDTFSNHVEPKDRDIAMVFQNYALYPHMTVYENLAFGLQLRHVPQSEIHKKVLWAARILKLEEYLERKPKNLSGGQRQRVSLGRAILRTPKVFLLDEPLSNLDAKLRTEMRAEIAKLHQEIGTTFIYVTHDQVEAMTMGTRIVVMSMGYVQQIDTPQNLYNYPENKFVAGFIGTPQMNFFPATLRREGDRVEVRFEGIESTIFVPYEKLLKVRPEYLTGTKKVIVGLRCEQISVDPEVLKRSSTIMQIKISHFEELGNETLIYGDMNLNKSRMEDSDTRIIVKQYGGEHSSRIDDVIDVALDMEKANFFDAETEKTIAPRIPTDNVFDVSIDNGVAEILGQRFPLPPAVLAQLEQPQLASSILIPTQALREGGTDMTATVVREEVIKNTVVTHLHHAGRTFFMVGQKQHTAGQTLGLNVDFKSITIYDAKMNELVKPLPQYDTFYGSYFDRANAKRSNSYFVQHNEQLRKTEIEQLDRKFQLELSELLVQPSLLKGIKDAYAEERKQIQGNLSYRLGTEDLGKEGKKRVKKEAEQQLAEAKAAYEAKVADYERRKAEYAAMSEAEKQQRMPAVEQLRQEHAARRQQLEEKYDHLIRQAQAGLEQACATLQPLEEQKRKAAEEELAKAKAEFAQYRTEQVAQLDAAIEQARAQVATTTGEERDRASIACKEARQARTDGLQKLEAEQNAVIDDIAFRSKVFALYINGQCFITSQEINKKIVKGLGAQLFISHYRFEAPHDAYTFSDDGMELTVEELVDYGRERFIRCSYFDEVIYVKANCDCEVGSHIRVLLDVGQLRIFENKFDIRLY